ncbi:MAG: Long-chain-fatty-acid--CoA ligase [Solirubrobacterales bacterium]|nr:Long-chain-fatty-acid--CoA ligase [Solirubrobacterales bacterium]
MTRQQRIRAVGLLAFLGTCFAFAVHYFSLAGTNLIPTGSHYSLHAVIPSAVSLAPKADVREAGVNVGKVTKIAGNGPDEINTLLGIELDSHAPVYRDARVYIRAKSVAGENYVEIDPGTPVAGALPSGGTLGLGNAQDATQIDQIFSIFDRARRADVKRALSGLGRGLDGGGQNLNRTLEAMSALPSQGSPAAQVLAHDRSQFAGLVDTFGTVTRALGQRSAGIQTFTRQVKVAATAVAARDTQLRSVLDQLPPFLSQAQQTAARLERFATSATPVVRNLRLATQDLVPAVQVMRPAAREGQVVVNRLATFATAMTPTLKHLRPFASTLQQFVPPLEGFLREVRPMVTYLAPYTREIGSFFSQDAASFQPFDAIGHVARIVLPISASNAAGVLTPSQQALLRRLEGSFDTRGTNAYPAPGGAGAGTPRTGSYPQVTADAPYSP